MNIRRYQPADCTQVMQLFYDTAHTADGHDYAPEQLNAKAGCGALDANASQGPSVARM